MPYSLPDDARPFTLHIPDDEYTEFEQLLRLSRVGPLTWENQHRDRRYGVPHEWLVSTKEYWLNSFDWRAQERRINSFPNYKISVQDKKGGVDLHFVGLFSTKEDAIPIVLLHGWPGSFLEFLPTLDLIQKKYESAELPFHIIVPSLPGYTLSSGPPQDKAWVAEDAAGIIDQVLKKLGFDQYVVQGGDVGCLVASLLGTMYDSVVGVHLNLLPSLDQVEADDPDLSEIERRAVQQGKERFQTPTSGAAVMNSTRPATIGAVVSSNPLALLAWIGEKFLEWPEEDVSIDEVLTNVSLYWFTDCFPRCSYTYRGTFLVGPPPSLPFINKPFGFSWFMHELTPAPKKILESKGKLLFYRQHEKITWYRPTDDFTTRSPNLTLVDDDPAPYYDSSVTLVYNNSLPWNASQVSTSKPTPTLHEGPMTFWVMVKRVGRTDAESPCTHLDPTILGSVDSLGWYVQQWSGNCYWYGFVNFTAGVTTSKQSRYLSGRVVEDQTPLDQVVFDANPWVRESLWLLPDLMTMIAVMNSTLLPTYDNIDGYVQQLLRQSYLAAWDMYHDSFDSDQISLTYKAIPGISRQLAEVSFARVFSWLGVCLLMTGSGFLLLVIVLDRRDIEVPEETLLEVGEERKSTGWDILNQSSSIALDMVKKIF